MGKINASDKIMFKNQKKRKYGNKRNFGKAPSKRFFLEWKSQLSKAS